jgi:hypothetical protein
MEFTFSIGLWGTIALLVGAVVVGVGIYLVGQAQSSFEWLFTSVGAVIGAFVTSEFIVGLRGFEPVFDGLALVPALVGGLVVGAFVGLATRFVTSEPAYHTS